MYWKIEPHESIDADYCLMPASSNSDHHAALRYAQDRLEEGWDEMANMPFGTPVTVTIELLEGEIPDNEEEE